jgi:opacity protein-like surface antigen
VKKLLALTIGIAALLAPAAARAESNWTVSPFVGASFGADAPRTSLAGGVSGGWMGSWKGQGVGGEIDLGYAPEFFEQNKFVTDRRLVTIMGNAVYGVPWKTDMVTPYVSGGLGVLRPKLSEAGGLVAFERNKFGMNLGGGATGWINKNVGVRGDIRYFRGLRKQDEDANDFGLDLSTFHFWRASVGISARF